MKFLVESQETQRKQLMELEEIRQKAANERFSQLMSFMHQNWAKKND
jgi:hypothetical protein